MANSYKPLELCWLHTISMSTLEEHTPWNFKIKSHATFHEPIVRNHNTTWQGHKVVKFLLKKKGVKFPIHRAEGPLDLLGEKGFKMIGSSPITHLFDKISYVYQNQDRCSPITSRKERKRKEITSCSTLMCDVHSPPSTHAHVDKRKGDITLGQHLEMQVTKA